MKQPTIKQVLDSINRLPGVHAVYSRTYKEFAVKDVNYPDATYFTEDRAAALKFACMRSIMPAVAMSYKTQGGE